MVKRILAGLILFFILMGSNLWATVGYRLEEFESNGSKSNIGYIKVHDSDTNEDRYFFKGSISPDLQLGPVIVGIDLNLYYPLDGKTSIPSQLQWFSFRKLAYDHDGLWGIQWGRLTNIEYGYGLLMDRYDTAGAGISEFTTDRAGTEIYYAPKPWSARILWTARNLTALRADYRVTDDIIWGKPLIVGFNYVEDTDGVSDSGLSRAKQAGYSVDAGIPFYGKRLRGYLEVAQLSNQGKGAIIGIGGFFELANLQYKLEYRKLGANFIPGYFNNIYETTSFNFAKDAPKQEINGVLGYIGMSFMNDYIKSEFMYEGYEGQKPILSGALGWKKILSWTGVVNYIKSFGDTNGGVAKASILYENFPLIPFPADAIFYITREFPTFGNFNQYTETVSISIRPNLNKIFNIPFLL